MAIPDYQTIMLPLLTYVNDGSEHTLRGTVDDLAKIMGLSDKEKTELYSTGQKSIFYDRMSWAKTYLKQAGLLADPKRGTFIITKRGVELLNCKPESISIKLLSQYPEFAEFMSRKKSSSSGHSQNAEDASKTPEELIEEGYREIRRNLEIELLNRIKECPPSFFEQLVVDVLVAMGYGGSRQDAGRALGKSGDGGIDGIINEDKLGLDVLYIQAKRWDKAQVGEPAIRDFVGSLEGRGAAKGIFITTSEFGSKAKKYVSKISKRVILVDGEQLARLMVDHGVGVSTSATYEMKQIDNDYFGEE